MDLTVKILEEIRDAVRATNSRLDQTNQRLETLESKVTGLELRMATSLMEVAGSLGQIKELFSDRLDLRDRVEKCEHEIERLKRRPTGSRGR